jgi:poly [ADP-ribose] polymerase 1
VVKMPLGKLSKKQLMDAYKVLADLSDLVQRGAGHDYLIELSNRFYTLMPHNFGMRSPPVINNIVMIQEKQEMIDNLLQIEVACKIMETDKVKKEVKEKMNPIDAQYEAMKVKMEPLAHDSKEFKMINDYMQNTHASTHSGYRLVLEDVYKVDREGEKDRYSKFSKLHNRQLLWHGSRKTNFVGILTNGLRIAPKEAPVSFQRLSLAQLHVLIPNRSPVTCSEKAFTSLTCARSPPTTASPANTIQPA